MSKVHFHKNPVAIPGQINRLLPEYQKMQYIWNYATSTPDKSLNLAGYVKGSHFNKNPVTISGQINRLLPEYQKMQYIWNYATSTPDKSLNLAGYVKGSH